MDFDRAAQRLQRESNRRSGKKPVRLSAKAVRDADALKVAAAKRAALRLAQEQTKENAKYAMHQCQRTMGEKSLGSNGEKLMLRPTSIHGDGDKITLPPSVLERLSSSSVDHPWMFRIGIPNPGYTFPSSKRLLKWSEEHQQRETENVEDESTNFDDDNNLDSLSMAYLDELRLKYLAFTHGTVVEFTQEEGFVGLPWSIATFLVENNYTGNIFRTKDPSSVEVDISDEPKTPGHLAWGAFDLPDSLIEITLIQLPKGKAARLVPSEQAIRAGFYALKDIKLVLEQSIIRTRATLTVHDRLATWHRGTRFDLTCNSVTPSDYNSICCINTDIEIEFDAPGVTKLPAEEAAGTGGTATVAGTTVEDKICLPINASSQFREEPPIDAPKDQVAHIQIRNSNGKTITRRFWKGTSTIRDLFDVAQTIESGSFRLVSRFPRRVWTEEKSDATLESEDIGPGKEVILIERL